LKEALAASWEEKEKKVFSLEGERKGGGGDAKKKGGALFSGKGKEKKGAPAGSP